MSTVKMSFTAAFFGERMMERATSPGGSVSVGVAVGVLVDVAVGVLVGVAVGVLVGVAVLVGVGV